MGTEEKILQAAMDIFLEKGLHGTKMQEIADKAEINKAMLHYYFRSKEKLYAHVFEIVFKHVFEELHQIFTSEESFETQVHTFVNKYIDLIKNNPRIPLFIIRELGQGGEVAANTFKNAIAAENYMLPHSFIVAAKNAVETKQIKPVDPRHLLITLLGSCVFFFIAEPMISVFLNNDPSFNREMFINQRKNEIINVLLNGIKP